MQSLFPGAVSCSPDSNFYYVWVGSQLQKTNISSAGSKILDDETKLMSSSHIPRKKCPSIFWIVFIHLYYIEAYQNYLGDLQTIKSCPAEKFNSLHSIWGRKICFRKYFREEKDFRKISVHGACTHLVVPG